MMTRQMNEQEKYETMWDMCPRYGKEWTRIKHGGTVKNAFLKHAKKRSASVMDFGVGNGTSLEWLESHGYDAKGIDIATNSTTHPKATFGDLRDPDLTLPISDYGFCIDVMEHIPTDDVDVVLGNIAKHVRTGVIFLIARDEDKDGPPLDLVLHLTREDRNWWDKKLLQHFSAIELIQYNVKRRPDAGYVCWATK